MASIGRPRRGAPPGARGAATGTVAVTGASCQPGPSPTSRALRLEGLRAADGEALAALLDELPDPPWDVEVAADDPLAGMLMAHGFETYARVVPMARPLQGMPRPPALALDVVPYRNAWAESFAEAQDAAMAGLAVAREMGTPTGYETAEGFDAFVVAMDRDRIVGFAQAALPDGWINWLGVVPDHRRQGVGSRLVAEIAKVVAGARGTHLAALVEQGTPGQAFLAKLGFRAKSPRVLMIRRADT